MYKVTSRQRTNLLRQLRQSNETSTDMHSKSQATQVACDPCINDRALFPDSVNCHDSAMSVISEPCSGPSILVSASVDVNSVGSIHSEHTNSALVNHYDNEEVMEPAQAFRQSLASVFVKGNLTHTQGNIILKSLHTLPQLAYLPRDTRTLLNTPRIGPQVRNIYLGEYLHIGFEKALTRILLKTPSHLFPDILHIDWSTDGARLNKSGSMQIWPIQCSVANIPRSKPEVVGIYKG